MSVRQKCNGEVTFAYIARPTYEKGLHLLLQAWSKLRPDLLSRARLLVYSPMQLAPCFQRRRLRKLFKKCSKLQLREEAVSTRLDAVYSEIDVALQPSLWVDHNCQTVLEALARGVPVIVPRHTSFNRGLVRDRENGLLIDLDDPSALLSAITSLIVDHALLGRLRSAKPYRFSDDAWANRVKSWCEDRLD